METSPQQQPQPNPDQMQTDLDTIKNVLSESDKERGPHRIIISAGNFLCGAVFLIGVPFILLPLGIIGVATPDTPQGEPSPTLIYGMTATAICLVLFCFALPFLLAGWGVLKGKSWGSVAAIIAGMLNLLNVPLGTAFAVYTFWAILDGRLSTTR